MTAMNGLVKGAPGPGLELRSVPVPAIDNTSCLVRVDAASICGTDLHIYEWDAWAQSRLKPPLVVGHEFAGTVVEVGSDVKGVAVGDRVAGEGHLFCGRCFYCRTGQAHICEEGSIIGVDTDGCFAEFIRMPEQNLWKLDDDVPAEIGAIHDPLGNAVHSVMTAGVSGKTVAVIGCGPIGLASVAVAKRAGAAAVFALDVNDYRRRLARTMGADLAAAPGEEASASVFEATRGRGVDVVLEMSGHGDGLRTGFDLMRKGGRLVLLGLFRGPVSLDLNELMIFKEATVIGVNGRRLFETWYEMTTLLRGGLDLTPVVTHTFPLADYEQAFQTLQSGLCGKIVLKP